MSFRVKVRSGALAQYLKSDDVRRLLASEADAIAARAQADLGSEYPVVRTSFTTDRAVEQVGIDHPAGVAIEIKRRPLRTAAASRGLSQE